ncbi:hypothetical protein EVAR_99970_1 [Eumeta japonica]|uniref:Uncharacterized protein n=1 Tax=Eumeta variegata TaxID=151549 RepID=A0A4C1T971_EUMVA|nr:hypothetical protein EVAR_99970_1 [Eumeta japonica]
MKTIVSCSYFENRRRYAGEGAAVSAGRKTIRGELLPRGRCENKTNCSRPIAERELFFFGTFPDVIGASSLRLCAGACVAPRNGASDRDDRGLRMTWMALRYSSFRFQLDYYSKAPPYCGQQGHRFPPAYRYERLATDICDDGLYGITRAQWHVKLLTVII